MLLSNKKHTDAFIEQTTTRPQGTLEFTMNKQMESFPFIPPTNSVEEGKCLLGVIFSEATNFVLNITDENKSFLISIPGRWRFHSYLEDGILDKIEDSLKLRSENDFKLNDEKVRKRGNEMK